MQPAIASTEDVTAMTEDHFDDALFDVATVMAGKARARAIWQTVKDQTEILPAKQRDMARASVRNVEVPLGLVTSEGPTEMWRECG